MTASTDAAAAPDALVITRLFNAPRALVFKLWSEPRHIANWWGPEKDHLTTCEVDFRVGGAWRFHMESNIGESNWTGGIYREIAAPERLAFSYYLTAFPGLESLVTVEFIERGAQTEMRFHQSPFRTEEERASHDWGWNSAFDCLVAYLLRMRHLEFVDGRQGPVDGVKADIEAARLRAEEKARGQATST